MNTIKAIYLTGVFCFLCLCTVQATTPEKEALWKELFEIKNMIRKDSFDAGLARLQNFEKEDFSKHPDIHSHIFITLAHTYRLIDQIDSSKLYLDETELLINEYALDSLKANLYRQRGLIYWKTLDFKSAIEIHLEGLKYAEISGNEREEMLLSLNLGIAYKNLFNLDSARYSIYKSLEIATKRNDLSIIASSKNALGEIEKNAGNLLKAMEHYFEAYRIAKIVRGDNDITKYKYLDNKLFDLYFRLGNLSSSLERINFIIEQKRVTGYLFNIDGHLLTKSSILLRMDSIESSELLLAELEQSYQVSENPVYHNQIAALKGGILYKKKQWEAAEAELSKMLPEVDPASLKSSVEKIALFGFSQLAVLKLKKGDYEKSISICEEQLKNKRIGHDLKKQFYGTLAACYKGLEKHGVAYKYLLQRDAVRDTIDRFYEGSLRLSKEQEMLDQQKAVEIEKLKYENEISQVKTAKQKNLLAIGGVSALLFCGLLFLWGRQRKLVLENSLADVKQQLLKLQVNPHFIFNVLNSIQNSVLTLKKEKSIELISKFSKLTRQILQNSDKVMVPIHEELQLLTNYMDLEKVRTQNKFDYEVMIDEGIDVYNQEIPSMILQLFVENAIWHGILPKDERGLIKLKIEKDKGRIKVTIEDDGIGRKMSANLKTSDQQEKVSMGMSLIKQRILALNKKYKTNIELYINDGKNGQGTQALLIA